MPQAAAAYVPQIKYMWLDHDTDVVSEAPPTWNQWYTVFDADDVRLLWCVIYQSNDEQAAKNVEVRWTIDGITYLVAFSLANNTLTWIYRDYKPSTGGILGLLTSAVALNGAMYVDKKGQSFIVEIRITSANGTSQVLNGYCVRETLEPT
jgi:hypothetical protein